MSKCHGRAREKLFLMVFPTFVRTYVFSRFLKWDLKFFRNFGKRIIEKSYNCLKLVDPQKYFLPIVEKNLEKSTSPLFSSPTHRIWVCLDTVQVQKGTSH